jgi:hypothetical protein
VVRGNKAGKIMKIPVKLFFQVCMFLCIPLIALAQDSPALKDAPQKGAYVAPTMKNFSRLYWALSMMDPANDAHIDNFILINECDIYKDYFSHEFEWKDVRESTRREIQEKSKNFPLRFKLVQALKLGNYDLESQQFEIDSDYQIKATRRLQVKAKDGFTKICETQNSKEIKGYPRALALELSRPLDLRFVPVVSDKANEYISKTQEGFRNLREEYQTKQNVFLHRDAYLVMKVKMFSSAGSPVQFEGFLHAPVMGVLEKIEIYADPELTDLLYENTYRRRRGRTAEEIKLKEEYKKEQAQAGTREETPKAE